MDTLLPKLPNCSIDLCRPTFDDLLILTLLPNMGKLTIEHRAEAFEQHRMLKVECAHPKFSTLTLIEILPAERRDNDELKIPASSTENFNNEPHFKNPVAESDEPTLVKLRSDCELPQTR